MKKNPKCKCNCHYAEARKAMGLKKHRDCRECARGLRREAKALLALERDLVTKNSKTPYKVEYAMTRRGLVDLLMAADITIHYLEAKRIVMNGPKGVQYKDYDKAMNLLLKIAGTKRALGIIKASKD